MEEPDHVDRDAARSSSSPSARTTARAMIGSWTFVALRSWPNPAEVDRLLAELGRHVGFAEADRSSPAEAGSKARGRSKRGIA